MLARNWWAFVARGILAVLFGLIALFMPGVTMLSLVLVFAGYTLADGVMAIIGAVHAAKHGERWSLLVLEGVADIIVGAAAAALPGITVVVFVALIAAWALITGSLMLAAAFELDADHGRWWFVLCPWRFGMSALGQMRSFVFVKKHRATDVNPFNCEMRAALICQ